VDKQTGDIWTAAHPVAYKAMQSINYPGTKLSPSQVSEHVLSTMHVRYIHFALLCIEISSHKSMMRYFPRHY